MNLFCILISFALVNVLVAEDTDETYYKRQVYATNQHIQCIIDNRSRVSMDQTVDLMKIIKNIVLGEYTMVEVALMLVEPENQEVVFIEQETQEDVAKECETQEDVARECETQDDVAIKTNKCLHLKNLVSKLKPKTSTNASASNTKTSNVLHIKHEKCWYQEKMQREIETVIGERCSHLAIDEAILKSRHIKDLGEKRRGMIFNAAYELTRAAVIGGHPKLDLEPLHYSKKCRLFGLHMSLRNILHRLPIIGSANIQDGTETCILTALDESKTKYKTKRDGIWQFNADGSKHPFIRF